MVIQTSYNELLLTESWQKKRTEILIRDGYRCRNCGSSNRLQVHHRQYRRDSKTGFKLVPWNYPAKCLVTLCNECHENGHKQFAIPVFIK